MKITVHVTATQDFSGTWLVSLQGAKMVRRDTHVFASFADVLGFLKEKRTAEGFSLVNTWVTNSFLYQEKWEKEFDEQLIACGG